MTTNMNRLQLKGLMLSVIMEIKHGQSLHRNSAWVKRDFKKACGLAKSASNEQVLSELQRVYEENGLGDEFLQTSARFGIGHTISGKV